MEIISGDQAFNILQSAEIGNYLIRFSFNNNRLVISALISPEPNKRQVQHFLVSRTKEGYCLGSPEGKRFYPILKQVLNQEKENFKTPLNYFAKERKPSQEIQFDVKELNQLEYSKCTKEEKEDQNLMKSKFKRFYAMRETSLVERYYFTSHEATEMKKMKEHTLNQVALYVDHMLDFPDGKQLYAVLTPF